MDNGIKILIMDDSRTLWKALGERLQSEGFKVVAADCESHALRVANEEEPDLIICDLDMKEASAGEVVGKLKESPETTHIPVIYLSTLVAQTDHGPAPSGKAVYVSKMCRCSELVAEIRNLLSLPA